MASEAGADYVTPIALHLRGEVRGLFFDWLREHRPDLVPRYKELYRRSAYAPQEERRRLGRLVSGPERDPRHRMLRGNGTQEQPEPDQSPREVLQGRLF
jgi:DNA repair photolyase